MYSYVKFNFKASLCFQLFDLRTPSGGEMDLKIWPRAQGKMGQKYQKNAKWPKISFWGSIWGPKVSFWGFWGLVCIEKWSCIICVFVLWWKYGSRSGRVNAVTGEGGLGCSATGRGNTSRPRAEHPRPPSPVTALTLPDNLPPLHWGLKGYRQGRHKYKLWNFCLKLWSWAKI